MNSKTSFYAKKQFQIVILAICRLADREDDRREVFGFKFLMHLTDVYKNVIPVSGEFILLKINFIEENCTNKKGENDDQRKSYE
jgi:hypothetical protein